jgi:hypothetical protein
MNDACSLMQKRLEEKYLPALKDDDLLKQKRWIQEVSGNAGTLFELDLGKFTQEELVYVFELAVGAYHIRELRGMMGLDPDNYIS